MKVVVALTVLCSLAMLGALIYGFGFGGGWGEVRVLLDYPWFVVSLFDVYVGFILFACWIASRERPLISLLWIIMLFALGNIIACVYVLCSIRASRPLPLSSYCVKEQCS